MKKSYIFVVKTRAEMQEIFEGQEDVLKVTDTVHILKSSEYFEKIVFKDIKEY